MPAPKICGSCGHSFSGGVDQCPICSSPTIDFSQQHAIFPMIPGYRIIRLLGQGGMGIVYLAEEEMLGRRVALKVVSEDWLESPDSKGRFVREAKLMATVEHPNLVRLYSFGQVQNKAYMVMEYVEGESLADRIRRLKRLSLNETVQILREVISGLETAWERRIVHRDIKPSNVFIDAKNHAHLGDFGLAKPVVAEEDLTLTKAGKAVGTLAYLSPEQIQEQNVDFRSDVYSLGIMMYQMLTGSIPFRGETPLSILRQHLEDPLPVLDSEVPETTAQLDKLLQKMTAKKPDGRFSSYAELAEALEWVGAKKELTDSLTKPGTNKKKIGAVGAIAILVILAIGIIFLFQKNKPSPSRIEPEFLQLTFSGDAIQPDISPDGNFITYISKEKLWVKDLLNGAVLELYAGDPGRPIWSPDNSQILFLEAHEEEIKTFLVPRLGGVVRPVPFIFYKAAWSPDGTSIAYSYANEKEVWIHDLSTGRERKIPVKGSYTWLHDLNWGGPDWLLVLLKSEKGIPYKIVAVRSDGSAQTTVLETAEKVIDMKWLPLTNSVYYMVSEATQSIKKVPFDGETGKSLGTAETLLTGLETSGFSLSRDGKKLVMVRMPVQHDLWIATLEEDHKPEIFQANRIMEKTTHRVRSSALSPDGTRIALEIGGDTKADIFTMTKAGLELQQITFGDGSHHSPAWSRDGKEIAFALVNGGEGKICIMNRDGTNLRVYDKTSVSTDPGQIYWTSPERILYQRPGNQYFHFLNLKTEEETSLVRGDSKGWIFTPRVSPDGAYVALDWNRGDPDEKDWLWLISIESGNEKFIREFVLPIGWSNDSQWIYATDVKEKRIVKISRENAKVVKLPLISFLDQVPPGWEDKIEKAAEVPTFLFTTRFSQSDIWLITNFDDVH